jgi:LPS-assembly protein
MIKFIIVFISIFLYADVRVFGESAKLADNRVFVDDSFLIKDSMFVSAKEIIYDKNRNFIYAKGDVYITYDKNNYILSNYVEIDLKTKYILAKPFFVFNFGDNSWVSSNEAANRDDIYFAKHSIASTCEVNNPDWKIVATSVKYDKSKKWIDLYNPILYIKDIPVLYLPYLGYSLDKTRSSGFLKPLFGFSENEGFLFTQPYYQTLGLSADLEIDPTIRTKRGKGIYSTFRFVHSPTSKGEFKIGEFRDLEEYNKRYNLANLVHNGWEFLYQNRDIISNDNLYINLKNANDVDYFYLDAYNYTFNTSYLSSKVLTSKINYIFQSEKNYFGIYAKYFKDTSKLSNEDTMQLIPQLNYHKFNDNFYKNLLVSVDANIYNYTRKEGYRAIKRSVLLPITYDTDFFDNYLKVGVTEQFAYNQIDTSDKDVAKSISLDTFLKIYSNLSKNYSTFTHHIAPSITFGMNNFSKEEGENEYINRVYLKKSISFKLFQYLLSQNWSIIHKISEAYYIDKDNQNSNYSDLQNDIYISYGNYYINDINRLSIDNSKINYNFARIGFVDGVKNLELSHIYQRDYLTYDKSESVDIKASYKPDGLHRFFGEVNYDMVLDMQKYYIIGVSMSKKCWNYSISYKKETLPLLTNDGISSIIQKTIYFQIELVPLGGIKQQYQFRPQKG